VDREGLEGSGLDHRQVLEGGEADREVGYVLGADLVGVVPLDPVERGPPEWVTAAQAHTARPVNAALHDGPEVGYEPWQWGAGNPSRAVDRAIMATRKAVFPENGLDVMTEGGEV
jgi:hypothetical protein